MNSPTDKPNTAPGLPSLGGTMRISKTEFAKIDRVVPGKLLYVSVTPTVGAHESATFPTSEYTFTLDKVYVKSPSGQVAPYRGETFREIGANIGTSCTVSTVVSSMGEKPASLYLTINSPSSTLVSSANTLTYLATQAFDVFKSTK